MGFSKDIAFRLVNARVVAEDIKAQSEREFERLKAKHELGEGDFVEVPYLINLDILFGGFFYNAKNIIRDLGNITQILVAKRFSDASNWRVVGNKTESDVVKFLKRKAREGHPGHDHSGTGGALETMKAWG